MGFFSGLGPKLKAANEALATAQKSWRDEHLQKREQGALERENELRAREAEVADQLREIRKLESRRFVRRILTTALLLLVGGVSFFLGVGVGSSPSYQTVQSADGTSSGIGLAAGSDDPEEGRGGSISVWSDPNARYTDEGSGDLPNGNLWAITRREGSSGVTFAKREIDCSTGTFRYLGEGDTRGTINDSPDASMGPLTPGSISTLVSDYTCRKHGRGSVSGS